MKWVTVNPYARHSGLYNVTKSKHHGPEGEYCYIAARKQTAEEQAKRPPHEKGSIILGTRYFSFADAEAVCIADEKARLLALPSLAVAA